ncbi:MAG: potassium/proton antiporter [Thermoguttaceae bacterium]
MPVYLFVTAVILVTCIALNRLSGRFGLPMLLAFILLGIFFGSDGVILIEFGDFVISEHICSIALVLIIFYGGFGTKWSEARPVAVPAVLLSTLGVVITAILAGLFCYVALGFPLLESFLLGSVISSTDAVSVFSILRSKRLGLKDNTASLLELESGSNDPAAYMLTIVTLSIMGGELNYTNLIQLLIKQFVYGIGFGILVAVVWAIVLRRFRFSTAGFHAIFVLAAALFAYSLPAMLDGNGYLSAYIAGIILGNSKLPDTKPLVHFFDGITGLMQMLIFFLLGLLSFPSQMPQILVPALLLALFLTFVARPVAVFAMMGPLKCSLAQKLLVSWAGLRGAASIVFALIATTHVNSPTHDIFHIVFCIVLFSIPLQGSLIPFFARRLNMIDKNANVLKTFNDYSDEVPVQFIELPIPNGHAWINKKVRELHLPPGMLLVLIRRGKSLLVPKGYTSVNANDTLVLIAQAFNQMETVNLSELQLEKGNAWIGKQLSEVLLGPDQLVVLIRRGANTIIPNGRTSLEENDILVINTELSA